MDTLPRDEHDNVWGTLLEDWLLASGHEMFRNNGWYMEPGSPLPHSTEDFRDPYLETQDEFDLPGIPLQDTQGQDAVERSGYLPQRSDMAGTFDQSYGSFLPNGNAARLSALSRATPPGARSPMTSPGIGVPGTRPVFYYAYAGSEIERIPSAPDSYPGFLEERSLPSQISDLALPVSEWPSSPNYPVALPVFASNTPDSTREAQGLNGPIVPWGRRSQDLRPQEMTNLIRLMRSAS